MYWFGLVAGWMVASSPKAAMSLRMVSSLMMPRLSTRVRNLALRESWFEATVVAAQFKGRRGEDVMEGAAAVRLPATGAEAVLLGLKRAGVDYLFANAG